MRKPMIAVLFALGGTAFAQGSGLKPGLWEVKQIKQVMDGRDMAAQMAAAQAQMQQSLAKMPPEQRKQMEAMMGGRSAGGGTRICISPAMAARDKPMVDPEGRCEPAKVSRSGNTTHFEFNCKSDGRTMVGKGESTITSDLVHTRMDMTTTDASGRHTMQSESQMKYLGPDCQGIKPADQLANGMRGGAR
jgi:hypothetical protein